MTGAGLNPPDRMVHIQGRALAAGGMGLAATFVGGLLDPARALPAYLFAYVFWIGLSLGSMAVLMLHYQVGGSWGYVTRRILEAGMLTLPLMAVLFVPILLGLDKLYPWANLETVLGDPKLRHQQPYLNAGFFIARSAMYFICWIACAFFLARWSTRLDQGGDSALLVRLKRLSGPGLLVYAVTMFFASVDWVMSTEPDWSSTIYGMITLASQSLSAFAMATAVLVWLSSAPPWSVVVTRSRLNDLGNLMLTGVMLWAYVSFSQYLIIWAENLPREISWYLHRTSPGWRWVALGLIAFHFCVPFVLLLFRAIKRDSSWIAAVAWGLLACRLVDDFWRVIPAFRPSGLGFHWSYLSAPLGIGGVWIALFMAVLRRRPGLPLHDSEFAPVLAEARSHA
ncbi:MAG TPA: hypothetical protein VMU54_13645 [Planctomycetota bacterium]|nr:hypothetical protein [Planctomycetota bacterium]